ncbi:MAG: ABC transporter substrate-binding protein [Azospirillaceae bacterium]
MNALKLTTATAVAALAVGSAQAQDVFVGHLADLTGATASIGVAYADGIADAFAWYNANGGIDGTEIAFETIDYAYQAPRAVSIYQDWVSDDVVAIQGWGTADTEALIQFVAEDEIPYFSASYSGALTDPTGDAERSPEAAPYNFFYGPSYSDACRALAQWSWEDWEASGGEGTPIWVHMGADHPYPESPRQACSEYATELGFEVADQIQYSMGPADFTAQCLTLNEVGADYAYLANIAGANIAMLNSCANLGVETQFVSNVWGYDENVMRAAGAAADGVVVAVRTQSIFTDDNEAIARVQEIAGGDDYQVLSYLAGVCSAAYMVEAMRGAYEADDEVTGPGIKAYIEAQSDWVPEGLDGLCYPSTWTAEDHRGLMTVSIYQGHVDGATEGQEVADLVADGVMSLEQVGEITLERRPEWLGY